MRHPLATTSAAKGWTLFVPLLVLTLVVMAVLQVTGTHLKTEAAPQGIVSFELAGDVPTAQEILDSWDVRAHSHAGFSLGFDFLFLVLYSTTIAYACVWLPGAFRDTWRLLASAGLLLAWGQWLAALLDAVENAALLVILLDTPAAPWPQIARWCAICKFALILLGLLYALVGAIWAVTRAVQRR